MADTKTATDKKTRRRKTARISTPTTRRWRPRPSARTTPPSPRRRAEVSNLDIVRHYFDKAADHLKLRRRRPRRLLDPLPRGHRPDPDQVLRRQDPRLLRLPHPAQRRPRPLQGRHPLPPRGRRRRGPRARLAHDLEDRRRERAVRRRQGRRQLRPLQAHPGRAPEGHPLVHGQDREGPRPHARHPRARRQHERPGDGVDDGRVRKAPRPHAGDRHRQAHLARGLARPRGRDRPRLRLHVPRGGAVARPQPRLDQVRRPGLRQRRLLGRAHHAAARLDDGRRLRRERRRQERGRHRRRRPPRAHLRGRPHHRVPGRRGDRPRGPRRRPVRRLHPRGARRHDPRGQRRPDELQGRRRGREQPHHPGRRPDPPREGHLHHPRRHGERRRRRRLLLRVGAEPPALPVGRARRERQARDEDAQGLPRRLGPRQGRGTRPARGRLPRRHRASRRSRAHPRLHRSALRDD